MAVGLKRGLSVDASRRNWDGAGPRPLAWTMWYPAIETAKTSPASEEGLFKRAEVAEDAPLRPSACALPLTLLSHGSGANAAALERLGWLLAAQGHVALAVDHHGHTNAEPYRAEGFLCLWERARDLSALLSDRFWREALEGTVEQQACVAGFSAGAYTALLLMGARVAFSQFEPDNPVKSPVRGPREFPDLADEMPKLHDNPVFRRAWERRRDDHSDARIKKAVAIAPGRSIRGFSVESLDKIRRPVFIVGADADRQAPVDECCLWLHDKMPGSRFEIITGGADHYIFLPEGSQSGCRTAPDLFSDPPGLNRRSVHAHVASLTLDFLAS